MKDEPLTTCPKCSQKGVKRLLGTGAGLIFKGSGFYITDYKKTGSGSKDGSSTSSGSNGSSSGASTGGETKSAAKSSDTK